MIRVVFDASKARKWWNGLGRNYFGPEFVQFTDAELSRSTPTDKLWQQSTRWND